MLSPMRKTKFFYRLAVCIFLLSLFTCSNKKAINHSFAYSFKKEVAKFSLIPMSSKEIKINIPGLKKVPAGRPTIFVLHNHTRKADTPKKVMSVKTSVIRPGSNGYSLPEKIEASGIIVTADIPEPFTVKEMTYKTPNPSSFASFDKIHGLKNSIVTCLLNDTEGNLWIGTASGVTKYNGHTFTNFTKKEGLIDNDVRSILQDRNGNIWFGTLNNGISKYDGYSFTNFTTREGLCGNSVLGMAEDDSANLWFASLGGGVSKYDGHSFENFSQKQGLIHDSVNTVIKDKTGKLWLGTNQGISCFDGQSFTNYSFAEGAGNNFVYSILEDKAGRLWFGTLGNGVYIFDQHSFTHLTSQEGLTNNDVFSLMQDRKGNMWIGTHYGLSKYDGISFTNYTEEDGLNSTNIYCLHEDMPGNIWIGTGGGGILRYIPGSFTHITESEGLSKNYIFSLYEDQSNKLWFGTWRGGVSQYDGHTLKNFAMKQGLPHDDVRSIWQDKTGNFWFATYKGVAKYDGHYFTWFSEKDGLVNDDVNNIFEDLSGNLWFGTEKGVSKYNGYSFTNFLCTDSVVCPVNLIQQDKAGNILLCTAKGFFKYDNKHLYHLGITADWQVMTVMEDSTGNLWLGTVNGLHIFDGSHIISLTENEGLINNEITGLLKDHLGNIWLGTRFGLSRLTPEKLKLLKKRVTEGTIKAEDVFFKNYSYADNFLGISASKQCILESKNQNIWVGTIKGVANFNTSEEIKDTTAPGIAITSVNLANEKINWETLFNKKDTSLQLKNGTVLKDFSYNTISRWYGLPQHLSLSYQNDYISFDFSGITTDQSQNVKYQYQLEGFDEFPNPLTSQATASYGNLSPDKYTFKVRALSSEGHWSKEAAYSFTIRPPWWQTWWFRIIIIALSLVIVFGTTRFIYNYQLNRQRAVLEKELAIQYERQRISSDLHDEIGSTLSSINIYSNLAKTEKDKGAYLDAITANINEVVGKLDDLVWKINPKYDSLESVIHRLLFYAEPVAAAKNILIDIQVEESLHSQKLDSESKHQLFLILKELVNNSLKHSGCNSLKIAFTSEKNQLQVMVADDGKGFKETQAPSIRNGLNNIKQRVDNLHWTIIVNTSAGEGWQTIIRLPFA